MATVLFADTDSLRGALAEAGDDAPVPRTDPDAAHRLGPQYLRAVVTAVMGDAGLARAVIDCGDDPGLVLKALAGGWRSVAFSGDAVLADKLADIAGKYGAAMRHEA